MLFFFSKWLIIFLLKLINNLNQKEKCRIITGGLIKAASAGTLMNVMASSFVAIRIVLVRRIVGRIRHRGFIRIWRIVVEHRVTRVFGLLGDRRVVRLPRFWARLWAVCTFTSVLRVLYRVWGADQAATMTAVIAMLVAGQYRSLLSGERLAKMSSIR